MRLLHFSCSWNIDCNCLSLVVIGVWVCKPLPRSFVAAKTRHLSKFLDVEACSLHLLTLVAAKRLSHSVSHCGLGSFLFDFGFLLWNVSGCEGVPAIAQLLDLLFLRRLRKRMSEGLHLMWLLGVFSCREAWLFQYNDVSQLDIVAIKQLCVFVRHKL